MPTGLCIFSKISPSFLSFVNFFLEEQKCLGFFLKIILHQASFILLAQIYSRKSVETSKQSL